MAGEIHLTDDAGQRRLGTKYVLISMSNCVVVLSRSIEPARFSSRSQTIWRMELYSKEHDNVVFGDVSDTFDVLDSRQPPSDDIAQASTLWLLYEPVKDEPPEQWPDLIRAMFSGSPLPIEVAIAEESASIPDAYAEVDWNTLYDDALKARKLFLERAVQK